jgi:hypothetical protein
LLFRSSNAARMVGRVDVAEGREIVSSARPLHAGQVRRAADAEVVKRREETVVERLPEAEIGCDSPVEVMEDASSVGALGRCGEADEDPRLHVREEFLVRVGGRGMKLVDDDDIEVVGRELGDAVVIE